MMNKLGILLLLTFNFSFAQNKKSLHLKGNIKELNVEGNYLGELDYPPDMDIYYFNKEQNLTQYQHSNIIDIDILYKYNKNGDLTSSEYKKTYGCESTEREIFTRDYKKNISIEKHLTFNTSGEYDDEILTKTIYCEYEKGEVKYKKVTGKKVSESFYTYHKNKISNIKIISGNEIKNIIYKYSRRKKEIVEKTGNKIISKEIIAYNKYDLPIKRSYSAENYNSESISKYKYDKQGNYIHKTTYRNGEIHEVEKRKITYY